MTVVLVLGSVILVSITGDAPFGPAPEKVTGPQLKAPLVHVQKIGEGLMSVEVSSI